MTQPALARSIPPLVLAQRTKLLPRRRRPASSRCTPSAVTAGAGAVYDTTGADAMHSATGAGALKTAGAGATYDTTGAGAMYSRHWRWRIEKKGTTLRTVLSTRDGNGQNHAIPKRHLCGVKHEMCRRTFHTVFSPRGLIGQTSKAKLCVFKNGKYRHTLSHCLIKRREVSTHLASCLFHSCPDRPTSKGPHIHTDSRALFNGG